MFKTILIIFVVYFSIAVLVYMYGVIHDLILGYKGTLDNKFPLCEANTHIMMSMIASGWLFLLVVYFYSTIREKMRGKSIRRHYER